MTELISRRLDCLKCPSLCCKMAGWVEVTKPDIKRLAQHLDLTVPEFIEKHIIARPKKGRMRIKEAEKTCQFLSPTTRQCTVYRARPTDCRGYNCWDHADELYDYARFVQMPMEKVRTLEARETKAELAEQEKARAKRRRKRAREKAKTTRKRAR